MRIVLFLCLIIVQIALNAETRFLMPPNLYSDPVSRKIVCYRPMRNREPNFSLEQIDGKVVVHNYGHGGAGWSLSVGSVFHTVELLNEALPSLEKSTPIAVLGSGCIGLFTAYHLWEKGFKNITIYADEFEDLTSHHAGGLLSCRAASTDERMNDRIDKIGAETYAFFRSIAEDKHPDFKQGASLVPTYFESIQDSELENLVGRGMEPAKEVQVDFGNGVKRKMIVYDDSLFIDTESMMHQLKMVLNEKIRFEKRWVNSFIDLSEKVLFNCTGIGSKALNRDNALYPVQGHLLMLQNQNPDAAQYMLIVNFNSEERDRDSVVRTLDFFPKKGFGSRLDEVGVLGGTFIEDCDTFDRNEAEFDLILDRAREFFYQENKLQKNT